MGIEDTFPALAAAGYEITSDKSDEYNCIAWAIGIVDEWWEPSTDGAWPEGVPREDTIAALIMVFEQLGFAVCDRATFEPGFEKLAIYGEDSTYLHAARQLSDGTWTSKLGPGEDITHHTLDALAGEHYGRVVAHMRRARSSG